MRTLRKLAPERSTGDCVMQVVAKGTQGDQERVRIVSIHCPEDKATALAVQLACEIRVAGGPRGPGAFVPHRAIPPRAFPEKLRNANVHFTDSTEAVKPSPS